MKLTAQAVARLRHEGPLHFRDIKDDGATGLYLRILKSGEKRWVLRYKIGGRVRVATFGDAGEIDARGCSRQGERVARPHQGRARSSGGRSAQARRGAATADRRGVRATNTSSATPSRTSEAGARMSGCCAMTFCQRSATCASTPSRGATSSLMLDAIRDRGAAALANRVLALTRRMFAFAVERGTSKQPPSWASRRAASRRGSGS